MKVERWWSMGASIPSTGADFQRGFPDFGWALSVFSYQRELPCPLNPLTILSKSFPEIKTSTIR